MFTREWMEGLIMLRAHREHNTLTVEIGGRATVLESPAIRELCKRHIAHGLRELRIDLRDCTTIDSTFAGTLLAIERQLAARDGSLTIVSPSPTVFDLLRRMALEDSYMIEQASRARGPWAEIRVDAPGVGDLKDAVLESHDELAHSDVIDRDSFRAVVDELRRATQARARMKALGRTE